MKSLVFEPSIPRFLATRLLGRLSWLDPAAGVTLEDVREPSLPGPDWARVAVRFAGICGSDTGMIAYKVSEELSALSSFPAVMGHELVGEVVEVGAAVRSVSRGSRVAVDPFLGCRVRGISPECRPCELGFPCVCERTTGGRFAPGMILGTCRDLPGSFCERIVCHESQLHRVADGVTDRAAALSEPLAIGLHAVLLAPPAAGSRVLVIGGGPIAFAVILALRMTGVKLDISVVAALDYQTRMAAALGADRAFVAGAASEEGLAKISGAQSHAGLLGSRHRRGGFETVYECVGMKTTVDSALRWTREKGTLVLIGNAGKIDGLDLTLVWSREVRLQGAIGYGMDEWRGERAHTFEWLARWLGPHGGAAETLVTHAFPLERHAEALRSVLDRSSGQSVKVLIDPRGAGSKVPPC